MFAPMLGSAMRLPPYRASQAIPGTRRGVCRKDLGETRVDADGQEHGRTIPLGRQPVYLLENGFWMHAWQEPANCSKPAICRSSGSQPPLDLAHPTLCVITSAVISVPAQPATAIAFADEMQRKFYPSGASSMPLPNLAHLGHAASRVERPPSVERRTKSGRAPDYCL